MYLYYRDETGLVRVELGTQQVCVCDGEAYFDCDGEEYRIPVNHIVEIGVAS